MSFCFSLALIELSNSTLFFHAEDFTWLLITSILSWAPMLDDFWLRSKLFVCPSISLWKSGKGCVSKLGRCLSFCFKWCRTEQIPERIYDLTTANGYKKRSARKLTRNSFFLQLWHFSPPTTKTPPRNAVLLSMYVILGTWARTSLSVRFSHNFWGLSSAPLNTETRHLIILRRIFPVLFEQCKLGISKPIEIWREIWVRRTKCPFS